MHDMRHHLPQSYKTLNTAEPSPPDPKATAIAAHVAAQRPSDVVVLFGSRSRGDHRSDSDIDIMVVYDTIEHPDAPNIVSSHSKKVAADAYLVSPRIDFLWVPTALFNFWSHTINHPIARALEEGTIIQGNLRTLQPAHRDNEPYHTQQLLHQAYDQAAIAKAISAMETSHSNAQELAHRCKLAITYGLNSSFSQSGIKYPTVIPLPQLLEAAEHTIPAFSFPIHSDLKSLSADRALTPAATAYRLMQQDLQNIVQRSGPSGQSRAFQEKPSRREENSPAAGNRAPHIDD